MRKPNLEDALRAYELIHIIAPMTREAFAIFEQAKGKCDHPILLHWPGRTHCPICMATFAVTENLTTQIPVEQWGFNEPPKDAVK